MTQSDYNQLLQNTFDRELNERELDQIHDFLLQNPNELADFEAVDQLLAKLPILIYIIGSSRHPLD